MAPEVLDQGHGDHELPTVPSHLANRTTAQEIGSHELLQVRYFMKKYGTKCNIKVFFFQNFRQRLNWADRAQ